MPARTGRPWTRTKARVIRRDGGICHLCGRVGADSADHLVPYSEGGTDLPSNLKAVHHNVAPYCNRLRGNRSVGVARADLQRSGEIDAGGSWAW